jgi:hypothetical protein
MRSGDREGDRDRGRCGIERGWKFGSRRKLNFDRGRRADGDGDGRRPAARTSPPVGELRAPCLAPEALIAGAIGAVISVALLAISHGESMSRLNYHAKIGLASALAAVAILGVLTQVLGAAYTLG